MQTHRDETVERRRELYREALAVIARDYATDIQIDHVARSIASSRRQLQRVFREVSGTSFRELLATARMSAARELLATSGLPIQEIAPRVGYQQPAQFSKSFRRAHGMSPNAYRKRARAVAAGDAGGSSALLRGGPRVLCAPVALVPSAAAVAA
jgi:transcriptional regulator GlxA family with amidase domain